MSTPKKFYLTTPIYYVNARPHIGHAYTTIAADVIARRHRLLGDDTWFLTGTDEHGQKIERSAAAAGIPPQQFTDQVSLEFRKLWDRMGLTYDDYIRTTEPRHQQGAQRLFALLHQRGQIYLSSYTGQYSVGEEIFVEGPPGVLGPDGKPTETVTEENFFFRLSEYQLPLIDLIESDTLLIQPESRKNEVLSFLRGNVAEATERGEVIALSAEGKPYVPGNLRDLSVSRSSFTWGIPVPEPAASETKQKHVIYVWLDALANYMTAVGYGSDDPAKQEQFKKYWPADVHIMAKEITRQHCIYWPAFLLAAGLPLPKAVTAHGWLLFDDSKMSKSKGNIVRTETILDAFGPLCPAQPQFPASSFFLEADGSTVPLDTQPILATKQQKDLFAADVLRYFLLREIPFGQDGSFSFDALITRYNADLANGYGNLVSRTLSMIVKFTEGKVPAFPISLYEEPHSPEFKELLDFIPFLDRMRLILDECMTKLVFSVYLENVNVIIRMTDNLLTSLAPWKLAANPDDESQLRLKAVLSAAAQAVRYITIALRPILPFTTEKVWAQLGLENIPIERNTDELARLSWTIQQDDTAIGPLAPIFPRVDKGLAQIMTDMESNSAPPTPSKLVDEKTTHTSAVPTDPTHPGAPPRTSALPIENPGAMVGGSHSTTTERPDTPSHTEAPASGAFATSAAASNIPDTPQIAIDDFVKVDLRVAQIIVAERIPKADKLLRLEVDLGYEKRQILSGIAEWYTPEELIGRRIVVIANLAPRKMRGLESHGMLLAASAGENGKPILATFGEEIALGSRLK
jgi:methionyl-tRNA synthetase